MTPDPGQSCPYYGHVSRSEWLATAADRTRATFCFRCEHSGKMAAMGVTMQQASLTQSRQAPPRSAPAARLNGMPTTKPLVLKVRRFLTVTVMATY